MSARYRRSLDDLERGVRVPVDQQSEGQDTDVHPEYVAPEDLDRMRLLADPAGPGRLRPPR